jgi:hypothetical protein
MSAPLHGVVFISDDPFPLRQGRPPGVQCHWEGERDGQPVLLEQFPAGGPVEEAIAWGRERAPLVLVRLGGARCFSAGIEDPSDQELPRWPPSAEALAEIEGEVQAVGAEDARRAALASELERLPFRLPPRLRDDEGSWTAYGSSLAPPDAEGVVEAVVCERPIRLWAPGPGRFAMRTADGEVREGTLVDLIAAVAELPPDDEHVTGLAALVARELARA